MRVCIDPGHGGVDSGAVGNNYLEKNLCLDISLELRRILVSRGIEVFLTREEDQTLNDKDRVEKVKQSEADICLSIHLNAASGTGRGAETIYQYLNENSRVLAELVLDKIVTLGIIKRRAYFRLSQINPNTDYYFILRLTRPITTTIVECLFIDNNQDVGYIAQADSISKIANAIADGICEYFEQYEVIKTSIMGEALVSAEQMEEYLHKINSEAPFLANLYLQEGSIEGIRGDLAFAQALLETNNFKFGGNVSISQNNFAGLGAIGGGAKGASFKMPREGVRAHIQHLKAYATTESLVNELLDPRFDLVSRGSAANIEDLNGKWAVPGSGYGETIVEILDRIMRTSMENWWDKYFYHLRKLNIIEDFHNNTDIPVWGEFAAVLYRMLKLFDKVSTRQDFITKAGQLLAAIFNNNDHWSKPYFEVLYRQGILENTHNPVDRPIWGEVAAGCSKAIYIILDKKIKLQEETDNETHWSKVYFELLNSLGILENEHNFDEFPTWAELAALTSKIISYIKNNKI